MSNQVHVVIQRCAHPGSFHGLPRFLPKAVDGHAMKKLGLSADFSQMPYLEKAVAYPTAMPIQGLIRRKETSSMFYGVRVFSVSLYPRIICGMHCSARILL